MSRRRVFYLDQPFENEPGGDKNRSRFLWGALRERFDADLGLIGREGDGARPAWTRDRPLAMFAPQPPPFPRPSSTPSFSADDREKCRRRLRDGRYDALVVRFCTGWELADLAQRDSPQTAVIMDVDMLSSRLVALSWTAQPSWRRRWFLFEKWKLERFERRLFQAPWLFLFTNPTERAEVRDRVAPRPAAGEFRVLPNTMPPATDLPDLKRSPVILFFGSMDSAANTNGFAFLVDEVLPHLSPDLKKHGVEIHVAGKNPPAQFRERLARAGGAGVKVLGGVDSMARAIATSRFVLLPLRIASGTRTRILEAAAQGRAVVTTPLGAEGLDLGDAILIGDTGCALAAHARRLLENPAEADALGDRLRERAVALYSEEKVAADLAHAVEDWSARGKAGAA